jgi:hypothetical protein
MSAQRGLAIFVIMAFLTLGTMGAYAQTAIDSPIRQWAQDELVETQMRNRFLESQRLFARKGSEENHLMVEREWRRTRRSVLILLATCLIVFFFFELPLSERDKVIATDQIDDNGKDVRTTTLHER